MVCVFGMSLPLRIATDMVSTRDQFRAVTRDSRWCSLPVYFVDSWFILFFLHLFSTETTDISITSLLLPQSDLSKHDGLTQETILNYNKLPIVSETEILSISEPVFERKACVVL